MSKFKRNDLVKIDGYGAGVIVGEGADTCETPFGTKPKYWQVKLMDGETDWWPEDEIESSMEVPCWWDDVGLPFCDVT